MAAKPIPPEVCERIIAEWRTGEYSQRDLAARNKVSAGMVAKLTKGVEQDVSAIVSAGVQYRQGLAEHDEQTVSAVSIAVDERTKHIKLFNSLAANNAIKASRLPCETHQDHERLSNTILRSKEVVLGKAPDVAVQINNSPGADKPRTLKEFYGRTGNA